MVKRICPHCHKDAYSADTRNDWICPHCGGIIPKDALGGDTK